MSGFNWLKWVSKGGSTQACSRSRRTRGNPSSRPTEALEERMLLSGTNLVPQIGTGDETGEDSGIDAASDEDQNTQAPNGYSPESARSDVAEPSGNDTAEASPIFYGPLLFRSYSQSSDSAQSPEDNGSTDPSSADPSSTDPSSTDPGITETGDGDSIQDLVSLERTSTPQVPRTFTFSVAENSEVGTAVGTVTATDPDPEAALSFGITEGNDNGLFAIDSATGEIRIADSGLLNFEALPSVSLTVSITDDSSPDYSDSAEVTVNLTNVNEAPLLNDTTFSIPENSPNSRVVGDLFASDPDVGSAFQFTITAGNAAGAFAINPYTGKITVANASLLNFETRPTYFLTVQVSDNGTPELSTTAQLIIQLTNTNDPPMITLVPANTKYTQGGSAVRFASKATISDPDTPIPDFDGVVLSVSIVDGRSNKDVVAVKDTGEKSKKIVVHGNQVLYGKTVIGRVDGGKGSAPTLSITLNSAASKISVEALTRALSFSTKDTSSTDRTLKLQLTSPSGHVLSTTSKLIQIRKQKDKSPGWGFF